MALCEMTGHDIAGVALTVQYTMIDIGSNMVTEEQYVYVLRGVRKSFGPLGRNWATQCLQVSLTAL